jgi:hypothetical protein
MMLSDHDKHILLVNVMHCIQHKANPIIKKMLQINWYTAQEYYSPQISRRWMYDESQKERKII